MLLVLVVLLLPEVELVFIMAIFILVYAVRNSSVLVQLNQSQRYLSQNTAPSNISYEVWSGQGEIKEKQKNGKEKMMKKKKANEKKMPTEYIYFKFTYPSLHQTSTGTTYFEMVSAPSGDRLGSSWCARHVPLNTIDLVKRYF